MELIEKKRKLISSFHQADLTEIQVINKNIKGLNRRTIYRTFKAINENKGIQRRPGSGRNKGINKSTFEIIKKCLEIDNGLSTFELSNKIFAEKGVKISSEAIRRYLVSQNYKYEKPKVLTIYLSDLLKKKRNDFAKKNLDWEPAYLVFTDEATFYGGPIRNWRWIAPNQSYDISAVKSNIKINVWEAICYSRKIDLHFYKDKTNSDVYINILKKYILKIKELVQDPLIIIRNNASYHCSQQTKEWIKKQSKGNFRLAFQFAWLKSYRERLGNNKGGATKGKFSKRSILINRIKEIYENIPYKYIEKIVESFVTRLQRCIDLEGDRTGY